MRFVLVLYYLCAATAGVCQKTEPVHLIKYSQKDGLPSYNVRKVVQDSKGFIWVGTQDGVSRFDGKTFLNYFKSSSKKNKICGVDVREIIEDTIDQLLWVLPGEVGINAISTITGEVVATVPIPGLGNEDWNISMIKDGNILWIGTSTGIKIYNTSKRTFETSLPLPRLAITSTDFETRSILKDDHNNVWAFYSGFGIVIYNAARKQIIKTIPLSLLNDHHQSNNIRFYSSVRTDRGKILLATSQGLRSITYSSAYDTQIDNSPCKSFPVFNTGDISIASVTNNGQVLISGNGKLCRLDPTLTNYVLLEESSKVSSSDWLGAVQNIYPDKDGNTWFACQQGFALLPKNSIPFKFYTYDKLTKTNLEHVRSLFAFANGNILVGLRNGIVHIDLSTSHFHKSDTGNLYHHVFQDKNGLIHVARPDGMFIYNKGVLTSIEEIYPEFSSVKSFPINSHIFFNDSTIVLGTESSNGILIWNLAKKEVKKIEQGKTKGDISSGIVNNIYKDSKNRLWILSDNVISILTPDLKNNTELHITEKETEAPYKLFFDMCEANGEYWITSYGSGLLQLDSNLKFKKAFNTDNGLCNDGTYQIYNVNQKTLLITTNNGLASFDLKTQKIKNYYEKDGLHSNSFEEVAGLMANGKIYVGGLNGFTIIDPDLFSGNNTPPSLFFSKVEVKTKKGLIDTSNLSMTSLTIPNNVLQTTIYFSALNYSNPGRTSILYKIKEQHADWIDIGNNNSLPLIGISHGTYTLQVKAINEDGVASEIKELTLIFLPKWYQTWWFRVLIGLLVAGIVYSLYRMRINQFKKEKRIRSRLASDLHDDLGSTMNSVKVYASLAMMEKQADKYLPLIKDGTQDAITGIRDIIWILDDKKDTIEDLLSRISAFASPICDANAIRYKQDISDNARDHKLGQEERRNLYMMMKEAINNAIKYSAGKNIEIIISVAKGKPSILIKDDGKGFDASKTSEGNGLKNMQRRAKEIKYTVAIKTEAGKGTSILFKKI